MKALESVNKQFGKVQTSARGFKETTSKLKSAFSAAGDSAQKGSSGLASFASALGRIAKYRVLRSIIKEITASFKEGLENVFWFSKGLSGEGNRMAQTLTMLSTKAQTMKNQLGSAFSELLSLIMPVLLKIISWVTQAANAISQLFASLGGNSTYYKAIDATKEFAKETKSGSKSAKELQRTLMKFDEINRLEDPNKGGGGGGSSKLNDAKKMFELASVGDIDVVGWVSSIVGKLRDGLNKVSDWIASYDWKAAGRKLYEGLKRVFTEPDWAGLSDSIFRFLGVAIGAAFADLYGFASGLWDDVKRYFDEKTKEVGGNIILGILKGIWDAIVGIGTWIYEHVVEPFVNGFKEGFGIHSPSTVMEDIGKDLIAGLWQGIKQKWNQFLLDIKGLWDGFKSWWQSLSLPQFHIPHPHFDWTYSEATGLIAEAMKLVGIPPTIPHLNISWYAQGGFPEDGLFMANHSEMIGQFSNGNTAVANNEQIVAGIRKGVYDAVTAALANQSNGSRDIRVYLDGKEIGAASRRYERNISRATGVSMA